MFVCKPLALCVFLVSLLSEVVADSLGPVTAYAYYPTYQSAYPQQTSSASTTTTASTSSGSQSSTLRPYYTLYHQNVYPGPFYTYTPPQTTAYTSGGSAGVAGQMMLTSASEMAAITHTERPVVTSSTEALMAQEGKSSETSKTKAVSVQPSPVAHTPGVVFGRPLGSYDGHYYVPVYYPLSWLGQQQQQQQPQAVATSTVPIYAYQPSFFPALYQSNTPTGSFYSPGDFYHPHGSPSYHYRVFAPPASAYRSSLFSTNFLGAGGLAGGGGGHADEMMPSDVTPDMNGNYKRSLKVVNVRGGGGSGQKTAAADYGSRLLGYDSLLESSSIPVIKYRDPKAEASLAWEAIRQRVEAQKQFEKEVLMLDENLPHGQQEFEVSRGSNVHNNNDNIHNHDPFMMAETKKITAPDKLPAAATTTIHIEDKATPVGGGGGGGNGKIIKNLRVSTGYRIESRSDKRGPTETSKGDKTKKKVDEVKHEKKTPPKEEVETSKSPVMTSIEIFDMPGANRMLGLLDPPGVGQLKPVNSTQSSLESLYHQLASLGF